MYAKRWGRNCEEQDGKEEVEQEIYIFGDFSINKLVYTTYINHKEHT